jgi:hypothetical protein
MTKNDDLRPADPAFFGLPAAVKASLRPDDRFLVSYPRSGNTWMRYVLTAGCALQRGEDLPMSAEGVTRVLEAARGVVPDLHAGPLPASPHPWSGLPYRLVKSHNVREVAAHRIVYLFRQPEDSLLSYAHYAGRAGAGGDRFVQRQVCTWAAEAEFALERQRENPERFFLLSYERILAHTSECVDRIARRLGLEIDAANRERAIALNDFRRLKSCEKTGDEPALAPGAKFFRRGAAGAGRAELRPETMAVVERIARPVYERLCAAAEG